ncbi:hypothetical protein [Gordonia aurantiaca]|uniref:hypothetical protein n=1 Tax=Gordonia sp. B21 TaxID=3151852 RepID=UPI003262D284
MTVFGSAHTVLADALHQACVACVCVRELRGEGSCADAAGSEGFLDAGTVTAFVVVALVIVVLALVTRRRERHRPGPRPTHDGDLIDGDLIDGDLIGGDLIGGGQSEGHREPGGARRG